ncbi:MAG: GntR family transcriptional regulator [Propionibacteriaceae bacterium]|nr:GntR family transcriptional regulator [Propionibacteriaceae bacterium]
MPARKEIGTSQLDLQIDRTSPIPIYHQLSQQLETAIRNGTLTPGIGMESKVSIARRLDLSRPTVRHAIGELVTRGLLIRRRGVGTTVAPSLVLGVGGVASLFDELTTHGYRPTTRVLRLVYGHVDERVALHLNLDPHSPLISLERLRLVDDTPIAILRNWLPLRLPELSASHLESAGLYATFWAVGNHRGIHPADRRFTSAKDR